MENQNNNYENNKYDVEYNPQMTTSAGSASPSETAPLNTEYNPEAAADITAPSETLPESDYPSAQAPAETTPEIDPIYRDVTPAASQSSYNYSGTNSSYQSGYQNYQSSPAYQAVYGNYGYSAPHTNHNTQGSPYFTSKPVADKQNISYQEVKNKRKKRGKLFRGLVAGLALILGFYGTYTLGNYQAEQRINEKLAVIETELKITQDVLQQPTTPIRPTESGDGESKVSTLPPAVNATSVSPVVAIADRVAPSVVTITTTVNVRGANIFFEPQTQTYKNYGSGILYKQEEGNLYVITNQHVVENGSDIRVIFHDTESVPAEVVGYDSRNDLAVLKIDMANVKNTDIHLATFGDSTKLKVGQLAVAIGNPLGEGHDHTITAGVISSVNRTLDIENIKGLEVIQTDAAINPGNSGGALVNEFGEVIGINTAKYLDVKVEGMGFAIPSSVAVRVVENIMKNGTGDAAYAISDDRPFLGIGFSSITSEIYSKTGVSFGVYVNKVYDGSAAAAAGVQVGDILFSLNGMRIKDVNMLFDSIGKLQLGETVKIGLVRNDKVFEVEAVITSFGEVNAKNNGQLNQKPSE